MKKALFLFIFLALIVSGVFYIRQKMSDARCTQRQGKSVTATPANSGELMDGDIIFQTSLSGQSKAIQQATGSPYSHCGIIYRIKKKYYVFEAVQPVRLTPLKRGKNGHYVVKRLKNADTVLTPTVVDKMKYIGEGFLGKDYDLTFEWSDDKMYCSELIWKIYQRAAGIEIGRTEKLGDFDLNTPAVRLKIKERYGNNIPMEETVISPKAIFDSKQLETVKEN